MNHLEVTDEQLNVISRALDLYSRVSFGQFQRILEPVTIQKIVWDLPADERENLEKHLEEASKIVTGVSGGAFGIGHPLVKRDALVATHLHMSIRHYKWKQIPESERNSSVVSAYPADILKDCDLVIKHMTTLEHEENKIKNEIK
jgi:hypothetical protein